MQTIVQRWWTGIGGGVAVTFAVSLPFLVLAVGGGIDVSNALTYRQKLASALELGCQQSALEINYRLSQGTLPTTNFAPVVNQITTQKINDSGLDGSPSATSTAANTKITINGKGASTTYFAAVLNQANFPVAVQRSCNYAQANQTPPGNPPLILESFEVNHNVAQNSWTVLGFNGTQPSGGTWNGWSTLNAGIEINGEPQLSGGSIRFGNFFAELDSDCLGKSPCHSNSTMYRIINLQPGRYEVRYWYISRVNDLNWQSYTYSGVSGPSGYGSTVYCSPAGGSIPASNANFPTNKWDGETNRIEMYVEAAGHYTYTGPPADVCIYSDHWIERSYQFVVGPAASDYRISWRAAGQEDTLGGLIDYLRLCKYPCQ